ncbi:MAG: histidine phosphatase family protein [Thermoplasmata archaeon]
MTKLYVVRHAEIKIDADAPPDKWKLTDNASDAVVKMLNGISADRIDRIYYSPLPKASQTADIINNIYGIAKAERDCLREVERHFPYVDHGTFTRYVEQYLSGHDDRNFERYYDVRERIVSCVMDILRESAGKSVMVVSHGMVITVLYRHLIGTALDPGGWKTLKMPDLSVIDLDTCMVERGFYAGYRIMPLTKTK